MLSSLICAQTSLVTLSFVDEESGMAVVEYFAYDVATESETDTITGKEQCIKVIESLVKASVATEDVKCPTESDIKRDSYVKNLAKEYKYEIVYLNI